MKQKINSETAAQAPDGNHADIAGSSGSPRTVSEKLALLQENRTLPAAEPFWATFRARARTLPRAEPILKPKSILRPFSWAMAAAAVLLLSLSARHALLFPGKGGGASIEIVEVSEKTDSFMIWEDAQGKGTVVWLIAQTPGPINGG